MTDPKPVSPEVTSARARLTLALSRQNELSTASVNDPRLEADYQAAVRDVVAAQTALDEVSR